MRIEIKLNWYYLNVNSNFVETDNGKKVLRLRNKSGTNGNNGGNNIWLEGFKADMKKYTAADADVRLNKGYVFVDISDKILFNSSSYTLTKKSKQVLATIASLLQAQTDLTFMIEGHTDNDAYAGSGAITDNWDLSTKRATAIVNILRENDAINPENLTAAGRGEYAPVATNSTSEGRAKNRRIEVILSPKLDELSKLLQDN